MNLKTRRRFRGSALFCLVILPFCWTWSAAQSELEDARGSRRFVEIGRFKADEARQAVAVDKTHFYAITNRRIGKYDKATGKRVAGWEGPADGPIAHLNSGLVIEGKLYCSHSNFPEVPMASSIEIFDTETLEHIGSHSLGINIGSATWIDRRDGYWWVAFAHYSGKGGQPGQGPEWTSLVQFDRQFRRLAGYVFPRKVIEQFHGMSNSGGTLGDDGLIYATGHDLPEIYVLRLPEAGSTLQLVETLPVTAEGQGIAWDKSRPDVLYTILRSTGEVVVSRLQTRTGWRK